MPLMIIAELSDAAPIKTLTTIQNLDGVVSIHTRSLPAAEIRRLMHEAPREAAHEEAAAPPKANGAMTQREMILSFLATRTHAQYQEIGAVLVANGGAAGSAGATLNKMQTNGETKNSERGWSLTAKGRRAAAAPAAPAKATNGIGTGNWKRGGFGNDEVIAMLKRAGGERTLDQIAAAFERNGKTRDNARQTIERLKIKKAVTTSMGAGGERIVKLKERAHAAS